MNSVHALSPAFGLAYELLPSRFRSKIFRDVFEFIANKSNFQKHAPKSITVAFHRMLGGYYPLLCSRLITKPLYPAGNRQKSPPDRRSGGTIEFNPVGVFRNRQIVCAERFLQQRCFARDQPTQVLHGDWRHAVLRQFDRQQVWRGSAENFFSLLIWHICVCSVGFVISPPRSPMKPSCASSRINMSICASSASSGQVVVPFCRLCTYPHKPVEVPEIWVSVLKCIPPLVLRLEPSFSPRSI